jgi:SAM-dependent methyltransferase
MVALFVELLAIRWLSADIRAFTVFKTFPLVACFIGFGVGYARGNDKQLSFAAFGLLIFCLSMYVADQCEFCFWAFPSASVFQWQALMLSGRVTFGYLVSFLTFLTLLLAGPFLTCMYLASRLGVLFEQCDPLRAYAYNLLGSAAGSILFTLLAFAGAPPLVLLIFPCLVLLIYLVKNKNWLVACSLLLAPLVTAMPQLERNMPLAGGITDKFIADRCTLWSPYQRIDMATFKLPDTERAIGLELGVNRAFYQYFFRNDFKTEQMPKDFAFFLNDRKDEYELPYLLNPRAKDVLVVGSGTGQNVAFGLQHGATNIDAVEIDPIILKLGNQYNPAYASPAVHKHCDDARHFFNTCKKKYDMVVFTLLDSHTVAGNGSSVRLDSYVYTKESFQRALSLLKPDGALVLSFASFKPEIKYRLYQTLKSAYGSAPLVVERKLNKIDPSGANQKGQLYFDMACGSKLSLPLPGNWLVTNAPSEGNNSRPILTDDWPYLYVNPDVIDWPYLTTVGLIVVISCVLARKTLVTSGLESPNWQMFFLGAGFLLLELASIGRLSLVFGSTWITSAVVVLSVLAFLLLANWICMRYRESLNQVKIYVCLFVFLTACYFLPVDQLSQITDDFGPLGSLLVALLTLAPICAAGLIFPLAFAKSKSTARALTFNILGAVLGGLLEYLSYFLGNSGLILVAAILYLGSFVCYLKNRTAK